MNPRLLAAAIAAFGLTLSGSPSSTPVAMASAKRTPAAYRQRVAALEAERVALAKSYAEAKTEKAKQGVRKKARAAILGAVTRDLFPAWAGTTWDFNGTSTAPREGTIACGYYVTTILRDAGFDLERARLAQQPSERIVKTLAESADIWRFRKGDVDDVIEKVEEEGEGLYVVGLDNHVGFLVVEGAGKKAKFCHSSYVEPAEVVCEDPAKSKAFVSNYHVVGRVLGRSTVVKWLEGSHFETVTK